MTRGSRPIGYRFTASGPIIPLIDNARDSTSGAAPLARVLPRIFTRLPATTTSPRQPTPIDPTAQPGSGPWLLSARIGSYSAALVALLTWVYGPKQDNIDSLLGLICALMVFAHVSYMLDRRHY